MQPMSAVFPKQWSDWLDQHIWPQIHSMMIDDAYFKLMGKARELTGEFNGPIAGLIEVGYVTCQTLAIRRLCDDRRDVSSLRRFLMEAKANGLVPQGQIDHLFRKLNPCDHIGDLMTAYL